MGLQLFYFYEFFFVLFINLEYFWMGASLTSQHTVVGNFNRKDAIETTTSKPVENIDNFVENTKFAKQIEQYNHNNCGARRKSLEVQLINKTDEPITRLKKQIQPKKTKTLPPLVSSRKTIADRTLVKVQADGIQNQESQVDKQNDQSKQCSYIDLRKQPIKGQKVQQKSRNEREEETYVVFEEVEQNEDVENDRSTALQRRSKKFRPRRIL